MDIFSLTFFIFLGVTFVLYYFVGFLNRKFKKIIPQWSILLVASLIFYGFSNYVYLIYLGASSLISYICALLTQYKLFEKQSKENGQSYIYIYKPRKIEDHNTRKSYENLITAIAIIINVGVLMILKYYNFFASSVLPLAHIKLNTFSFIVPLGISFYTFSLISYNVDTCRRENDAEKNPLKFLLYVSYFPRIIQGPISSYKCLSESNLYAENKIEDVDYGKAFLRISIGLVKKIAIANVFGLYVDAVYDNIINTSSIELALITIFYSIQLYADFSGFMDIVIGISALFGIKLEENFNIPYISSSVQEFWRRWHISLGAWLKKYIYIPLGGNRVKIWRWIINIFIVWFISGFWHGAQYTYIAWGLIFGFLIAIEGLPKQIRKNKGVSNINNKHPNMFVHCLKVVLTFLIVNFTWIFFRSPSLKSARLFIKRLVKMWEVGSYSSFMDGTISKANFLLIVSMILIIVLIFYRLYLSYKNNLIKRWHWLTSGELIARYVITIAFVSISLFTFFYMKSFEGSSSSFIYFEF